MVVEYENTAESQKKQMNGFFVHTYKQLFILLPIVVVVGIAALVVAYTITEEEINAPALRTFGFVALGIAVFCALCFTGTYVKTKQILMSSFYMGSENGKLSVKIEQNDEGYVITNITKGNVTNLANTDISSATVCKSALLLALKSKQSMLFPPNEDICRLFEKYISKKR